jgi:uncharacterized membrane protein YebE (DUF533 family)
MDAIDILGSLLGRKSSGGGRGGEALKDIFGRGAQSSAPARSKPGDISQQAKELEDLLNVANQRQGQTTPRQPSGARPSSDTQRQPPSQPQTQRQPQIQPQIQQQAQQQQALILIRAMVNAAKADGRIDEAEQNSILQNLRNPTAEAIQFLKDEFQRPLDTRGFAMSVPVGMEQQVYTMSLIAIDLDTAQEAKYLMELAENLRLPADVREQIHQRLGAPSIY